MIFGKTRAQEQEALVAKTQWRPHFVVLPRYLPEKGYVMLHWIERRAVLYRHWNGWLKLGNWEYR